MSIIFQKLSEDTENQPSQQQPVETEKNIQSASDKGPENPQPHIFSLLKQFKFLIAD